MALVITVTPAGDGWVVRSDAFHNELVFRHGGRAETAARALADRYAQSGRAAQVQIYLRDGAHAGTFDHPASEPLALTG